jgi:hypothetical protein
MTENDINIYNNGKIYTIRCKTDNDLIYVGSTTQPLHKRWHTHKSRLNNSDFNDCFFYKTMIEIGKEHFYIELYENYSCNSKEELNRREGEVIRDIGTLNSNITGRTPQEYRKDNKEHYKEWCEKNKIKLKEYNLEYKKEKKEQIKQQQSQPFLCACGCTIQKQEKNRHQRTQKHINLMSQKEEQK